MPIMLVFSYVMVENKPEIGSNFFFSNKHLGLAAVIYAGTEIFLTKIRVSATSVTMANIAVLIVIPIIMILMSMI